MENVSEFTVRRLSGYYRILQDLERSGVPTVSSARLADLGGVTPAQVRKDLSYFGSFGTRGLGYDVRELRQEVARILGLNRQWKMALFGAGSLGHALFFFQGFREDGFFFTHIFDTDPEKVGQSWSGIKIMSFRSARTQLKRKRVDIGVIATPKEAAQEIVDLLVSLGIRGILNFTPRQLVVPEDVMPRYVNLAVALESISFFLTSGKRLMQKRV